MNWFNCIDGVNEISENIYFSSHYSFSLPNTIFIWNISFFYFIFIIWSLHSSIFHYNVRELLISSMFVFLFETLFPNIYLFRSKIKGFPFERKCPV